MPEAFEQRGDLAGLRTVVSGGVVIAASSMSSKPTTANSLGIVSPRSCAASITPIALRSFEQKTAVGRGSDAQESHYER